MVGSVDLITHTMLEKEAVNWYVAVGQYLGSPDKKKPTTLLQLAIFWNAGINTKLSPTQTKKVTVFNPSIAQCMFMQHTQEQSWAQIWAACKNLPAAAHLHILIFPLRWSVFSNFL